MSAWESEEWFLKWLELARIEMSGEDESFLPPPEGAQEVPQTPLGCSHLLAPEEDKMAA
jgi:hypothetical protein